MKLLLFLPIALLAIVFARPEAPGPAAGMTGVENAPQAATAPIMGDVNCDEGVDAIDSLLVLRADAGLSASADCLDESGDTNCSGGVDAIDSLRILRYDAGLTNTTPDGCTPIGDALGPLSPQALAAKLYAATNTAGAEALLRNAYPEIDVGLYTGDGQQIIPGAETGLDDFYLYDFESELLARNLVERQLFGLDTATLFLGEAGVTDEGTGQPFTDADLLSLIAAKVIAARADDTEYTWRLVDELGLVRADPLDLVQPGLDPDATYLDSVQTFLVLYDMTMDPVAPAAVSAEVPGVAVGFPDAETRALHEYASRNVRVYAPPVEPVHWKHDAGATGDVRTFSVSVSYPGDVVILAGPLAGFDPADFLVSLDGSSVWWLPEATLIPQNGRWAERVNTYQTDTLGVAKIDFIPRTECPPAGQGPVVTETHQVVVQVQPTIKSVFPPHSVLGLVSVFAQTEIEVSRHTGSTSRVAAAAGQFPCAYEGTASAVHDGRYGHPGVTESATGTNLRFELVDVDPDFAVYELVAGHFEATLSGGYGPDCTYTGQATFDLPEDSADFPAFRYLSLDQVFDNTYTVAISGFDPDAGQVVCGNEYPILVAAIITFEVPLPADLQSLKGSKTSEGDVAVGSHSEYEWDLHAAECQPSPEPVCQ